MACAQPRPCTVRSSLRSLHFAHQFCFTWTLECYLGRAIFLPLPKQCLVLPSQLLNHANSSVGTLGSCGQIAESMIACRNSIIAAYWRTAAAYQFFQPACLVVGSRTEPAAQYQVLLCSILLPGHIIRPNDTIFSSSSGGGTSAGSCCALPTVLGVLSSCQIGYSAVYANSVLQKPV